MMCVQTTNIGTIIIIIILKGKKLIQENLKLIQWGTSLCRTHNHFSLDVSDKPTESLSINNNKHNNNNSHKCPIIY